MHTWVISAVLIGNNTVMLAVDLLLLSDWIRVLFALLFVCISTALWCWTSSCTSCNATDSVSDLLHHECHSPCFILNLFSFFFLWSSIIKLVCLWAWLSNCNWSVEDLSQFCVFLSYTQSFSVLIRWWLFLLSAEFLSRAFIVFHLFDFSVSWC